jgi:selenide,water dikinase
VRRNRDAQAGDRLVLGKPLGVGICSAALKKGQLDDAGYAAMLASTTQLNTPGPELAALEGVHALTDVTGFGLAGHALEMARGSGLQLQINWSAVPLLAGCRPLAEAGFITDRALLSDPQTSGGLLVSCDAGSVAAVLEIFQRHGFSQAAEIGGVAAGQPELILR